MTLLSKELAVALLSCLHSVACVTRLRARQPVSVSSVSC